MNPKEGIIAELAGIPFSDKEELISLIMDHCHCQRDVALEVIDIMLLESVRDGNISEEFFLEYWSGNEGVKNMKCKDCNCAVKGFFGNVPKEYVCIGVKEPFIIRDINGECTEYKDKKVKIAEDGLYVELFAIKNGVRYNAKILNMRDVATTLTSGLMDGLDKMWEEKI